MSDTDTMISRPMRSVSIALDDATLDAIDAFRVLSPNNLTRSAAVRKLVQFAVALMLSEEAQNAWLAHMADSTLAETAPAGRA